MNTILFNKYTGDVYKVIQNKVLMLGWDIMGPFWDLKSNFENQDSNIKEEECFNYFSSRNIKQWLCKISNY